MVTLEARKENQAAEAKLNQQDIDCLKRYSLRDAQNFRIAGNSYPIEKLAQNLYNSLLQGNIENILKAQREYESADFRERIRLDESAQRLKKEFLVAGAESRKEISVAFNRRLRDI